MEKKEKYVCLKGVCFGILFCIFVIPVFLVLQKGVWEDGIFTWKWYREVFLLNPIYLKKFWESLFLTLILTAGQMGIGILAAFGISVYELPGRRVIEKILLLLLLLPIQVLLVPQYIVLDRLNLLNTVWAGISVYELPGRRVIEKILLLLLLLPIQVLLVPQYIVLDRLNLLNTVWALVLPYCFLPFSAFFLLLFFKRTDREVLDAARLDGAGSGTLLVKIVIPVEKKPVTVLSVLVFLYAWSMVEQPMVFLENPGLYPLSVYLFTAPEGEWGRLSPCGLLSMIPILILAGIFLKGREER